MRDGQKQTLAAKIPQERQRVIKARRTGTVTKLAPADVASRLKELLGLS